MLPLARKEGWASFHDGVCECLGLVKLDLARKLSAKARGHILTYQFQDKLSVAAAVNGASSGSLAYADIEKFVKKKLKCH
jgi:hypothetical protein